MLTGLVTKNGILIVEVANQNPDLIKFNCIKNHFFSRLRPTLNNKLSTILGTLPIALATEK